MSSYNIDDPAVAAAGEMAKKIRAQAQASALAKRQQAAIQYGSAEGLQGIFGSKYGDVARLAASNPYSTLTNLKHGYETGVTNLEEALNKANLFYGGYRGQQLGEAAHQYQQSRYNAGAQFQGLLTDVADQLSQALMQADMLEMQAALQSQYVPPSAPAPPELPPPAPTAPTYTPPAINPATIPWTITVPPARRPIAPYAGRH